MPESSQNNVFVFFMFIVVVVAIAATAATITTVRGGDIGFGDDINVSEPEPGGGSQIDPGDINQSNGNATREPLVDLQICIHELQRPISILGIGLGLTLVLGLIYFRFNFATTFLAGTALVPPVFGLYFLLTNCPGSGPLGDLGGTSPSLGGGGGGGAQSLPIPSEAVAGVLVLLAGIAIVAAVVSTRDDEHIVVDEEDEEAPDVDTDDFARAAQRAVDRIEQTNVSVDNAVYEAWVEMIGLLDMSNPEVRTPRDFAYRAVETGLDEADVWELTELFVEVRYGNATLEDREQRALDILSRFAESYRTDTESHTDTE